MMISGYTYKYRDTNIPKDSITVITSISKPVATKFTLTSLEPHLHLLGQSIRVEIISKDTHDTSLVISVPKWDFNWQEFYYLEKPVIINVGDRIMVTSTFDNTRNNTKNPYFPPRDINFGGMATTNEMINVVLLGLAYQQGDELLNFYNLDSRK